MQTRRRSFGAGRFLVDYCENRSSVLCLDKEAMHNPQQKVTSGLKKNKNPAGDWRVRAVLGGDVAGKIP